MGRTSTTKVVTTNDDGRIELGECGEKKEEEEDNDNDNDNGNDHRHGTNSITFSSPIAVVVAGDDDDGGGDGDQTDDEDGRRGDENENNDKNDDKEKKPKLPKTLADHSRMEYAFVLGMGFCLSASAGYSNAVCISGHLHQLTSQSVAGVTGLYTMSAILLIQGNITGFGFDICTILSVMVGACFSALMNPRAVAFEVGPKFGPTFLIAALFYLFGAFEAFHNAKREFYFTALANGIQNGMTSMYSANLLRTTHVTGTTTDIGLIAGQILRGNRANYWKFWILVGLAGSFWVGSAIGYLVASATHRYALLYNAIFFCVIGLSLIGYFVKVHHVSVLEAIFGLGKWGTIFDKVKITTTDGRELSERELLQVFDDLDEDHDGHIEQDELMQMLSSRNLSVKRRDLIQIIHGVFAEHDDDGDWTISRADWTRLVHSNTDNGESPLSFTQRSSPEALRRSSIADIEFTGSLRHRRKASSVYG